MKNFTAAVFPNFFEFGSTFKKMNKRSLWSNCAYLIVLAKWSITNNLSRSLSWSFVGFISTVGIPRFWITQTWRPKSAKIWWVIQLEKKIDLVVVYFHQLLGAFTLESWLKYFFSSLCIKSLHTISSVQFFLTALRVMTAALMVAI